MPMQKKSKVVAVNGVAAPDEPRIAWHMLDIMTSLELAEADDSAGEINVLAMALSQGLATPQMVERLLELRKPENQRPNIERRMEAFAKYVVYVPSDWFVDDAPDPLDFSDPATYRYLRTQRFGQLYQLLAFGSVQGDSASGN